MERLDNTSRSLFRIIILLTEVLIGFVIYILIIWGLKYTLSIPALVLKLTSRLKIGHNDSRLLEWITFSLCLIILFVILSKLIIISINILDRNIGTRFSLRNFKSILNAKLIITATIAVSLCKVIQVILLYINFKLTGNTTTANQVRFFLKQQLIHWALE